MPFCLAEVASWGGDHHNPAYNSQLTSPSFKCFELWQLNFQVLIRLAKFRGTSKCFQLGINTAVTACGNLKCLEHSNGWTGLDPFCSVDGRRAQAARDAACDTSQPPHSVSPLLVARKKRSNYRLGASAYAYTDKLSLLLVHRSWQSSILTNFLRCGVVVMRGLNLFMKAMTQRQSQKINEPWR